MDKQYWQRLFSSFLQLVSICYYTLNIYIHVYGLVFLLFLTFYTQYWPLVLLAVAWTFYDRDTPFRGGRSSNLARKFPLLKYLTDYFPARLVKTADLNVSKNYIFCTHPHGVLGTACVTNFVNGYSKSEELFPGLRFYTATLNMNFNFPIIRDYILALGFVSASSTSLKYLLNDSAGGNAVNLFIGGATESFITKPGAYRIVLKKRKGFIKIALNTGCCLVPVFNFGENDVLQCLELTPGSFLYSLQQWTKRQIGAYLNLPIGRSWLFKLLPKRVPLTTVVGKPIMIPKVVEPTEQEIDHYHSVFMKDLVTLFNDHKHKYVPDPENTDLIIVE